MMTSPGWTSSPGKDVGRAELGEGREEGERTRGPTSELLDTQTLSGGATVVLGGSSPLLGGLEDGRRGEGGPGGGGGERGEERDRPEGG